ncbi:hypothetical protein BDB01DRAFT_835114 [Pilobolus umbonatus]|nr:hypothetical protein BDB01DRAFT_835114 [Pilobolus umbonatus]
MADKYINCEGVEVYATLKQLARICEITQQFSITNAEMIEMEGHASPKVFTINQHLLSHLSLVIRALDPLRLISPSPLERTVGQVKSRILSRSMAGKNSANVIAKIFPEKRRGWSSGNSVLCLNRAVPREKRDMVFLGEYCSSMMVCIKVGTLMNMYAVDNTIFIAVIQPLPLLPNPNSIVTIEVKHMIGYAITVPSLTELNKIYMSWKK